MAKKKKEKKKLSHSEVIQRSLNEIEAGVDLVLVKTSPLFCLV